MPPPRPAYDSSSSPGDDDRAPMRRIPVSDSGSASVSVSGSLDSAPRGHLLRRSRNTRRGTARPPRRMHSDSDDDDDDSDDEGVVKLSKKIDSRPYLPDRISASTDRDFDDDDDEEESGKELSRSHAAHRGASVKKMSKARRTSGGSRKLSSRKKVAAKKPVQSRRFLVPPDEIVDEDDDEEDEMDVDDSDDMEDDDDVPMNNVEEDDDEDDEDNDDDDDDDEVENNHDRISTKRKPSRPLSGKTAKPPSGRRRSKAIRTVRGKSAGKGGGGRRSAKSKTPESTGRRNPQRSTRGRHSALELLDDDEENADFLASDIGDDSPVDSPFAGIDVDNLAPSIYAHRVMEKILGRRHRRDPSAHPPPISDANSKANPPSPHTKQRQLETTPKLNGIMLADEKNVDMTPSAPSSPLPGKSNGVLSTAGNDTRQTNGPPNSSAKPPLPSKDGHSKPSMLSPSSRRDGANKVATESESEFEYLVKWKHLSYIHCEWVDESVVLKQSQGKSRLRRFLRKQEFADLQRGTASSLPADSEEDELIPEDFVTIDRVLSDRTNARDEQEYFVKWCALPYSDSSWELAEDVKDDNKISEYQKRNERPPEELLMPKPHPPASEYKTLPMPKFRNDGALRDYQMEGFNWLVSCWYNQQGCILADEMGLGKTIQSVSYINELFVGRKILGPFLVLAPLSTLGHWQREFQTWTELNTIVYHGSTESRRIIQEFEWSYGTPQKGPPFKWHVMITTYETILQDANKLKHINWKSIVVDEAHRLKNRASRLVDELKNFKAEHRVLLTGTPIQNNSLEVWALLNFLEPAQFMSEKEFSEKFGDIKDAETVDSLKALLRPFLLRRLKEDVEKSIPPKEETVVSVELTRVQKKWYRAMLEQNFSFLDKGAKSSNVGNLRNIVMELRKCCNHPYLIKGVEQIETAEFVATDDRTPMRHLVEASGKMVLVDKLLPELKKQGHRVLVFSQMIRVLDILEDYLLDKRWGYERIDGRVRGNDRQQAIDRFSKQDTDKFVFLLCTRAGGQGINLTVADTVIIYDSDWNPQNDVQAQARCHRIGQKTEVKVYRLITRGTYEQDMFDRASKKLGLDQAILQNMGKSAPLIGGPSKAGNKNKSTSLLNDMHRADIDSLLKKGAYDVFNEDNAAADAFTSEDIHEILSRRTKVLRSTAANAGPSEFSKAAFATKASFAAESENAKGPNVDLDDPDFWKKLMPEASAAPDPNIEVLPRRRRQTVRYQPKLGSDESDMDEEVSGDEGPAKFGANGKRLFNKGERHRLQRALLSMGWGRWHEILEFSGSPVTDRRNVDDVAQFCKGLMRFCWEITEKSLAELPKGQAKIAEIKERVPIVLEEAFAPHRTIVGRARLRTKKSSRKRKSMSDDEDDEDKEQESDEDVESEEESEVEQDGEPDQYGNLLGPADPEVINFTDPILFTEDYVAYLDRNGTSILERMELLAGIRNLELNGSLSPGSEMPVVGASGSQALEDWWDASFDRDLLRGTYKHGFGSYQQMLADPALVFLGRVQPPTQQRQKESSSSRNHTSNDGGSDSDGSRNGMSDSEGRNRSSSKKVAKSKLHREQNGKHADEDDDNSSSDSDDGNNTDDEKRQVMFVSPEEMARRKWPQVNVLNVRVRKLVRGFVRMKKRAERQAKLSEENEKARMIKEEKRIAREQQREEQNLERERKLAEANRQWSKKEKSDFAKYMCTNGGPPFNNDGEPSWALVKERAVLPKKEPSAIAEYSKEFSEMCATMLVADEWCRRHKAPLSRYFEVMGPKLEDVHENDKRDVVRSEKPESKPRKKRGGSRFTLQQMEDARVTIVNAKKFTERSTMIDLLRREVLTELLDENVVKRIEKKGALTGRERLPEWWLDNRVKVDIGLLRGVATHGFDHNQIALDESLPFRDLLAQAIIEYIRESLKVASQNEGDFDADDIVIPANIREVVDADIVKFTPKDKMFAVRTQRLINIIMPKNNPENGSPGKTSAQKSKSGSKLGHRKRQHSVDDFDVKPVIRKGASKGGRSKALKMDGGLLCTLSDGALAGVIPNAFESVPAHKITRRLLRFLKQQKKIHSNVTIKLELPDWVSEDHDFGRVNADGSEYVIEGEAKPRPAKRRRTTGNAESTSKGESELRGSDAPLAGTRNAKDARVKESIMHKVEVDENGDVVFPIRLGVLTIENLGTIDPTRKAFHTERTIYPIGYRAVREYVSMVDITRQCKYVCEILDDGGPAPVFQVTCMDGEQFVKKDTSSSACWTYVMSAIRDATPDDRKRLHTTVSGPEYFGLSNSLVQELIQDLSGAELCEKYVRKTFVSPSKVKRGEPKVDRKVRAKEEPAGMKEMKSKRAKRRPERYRDDSDEELPPLAQPMKKEEVNEVENAPMEDVNMCDEGDVEKHEQVSDSLDDDNAAQEESSGGGDNLRVSNDEV